MSKLTLNPIIGNYASVVALNDRFQQIEDVFNNDILWRDGFTGEANEMSKDLDMNDYRILNQSNAVILTGGFNWLGDWSVTTTYSVGDAVYYNGTSYVCILSSLNNVPPNTTYWQILATASLPAQPGNTNKVLETDGTNASWENKDVLRVDDKATLLLLTPETDQVVYIASADGLGNIWRGISGASAGTYSDDGGSYCGTEIKPTSGDGSAGWVRDYNGPLNVAWYGVVSGGVTDNDVTLTLLDALNMPYYVPAGTYLYTGDNLPNIANMIRESEGVIFTNGLYTGNISWDRSGNIVGLHHNHMEEKAVLSGTTPQITTGNIVAPPIFNRLIKGEVDIVGFWYQDFGLDAIRDSSIGWNGWYSWEWAHTDSTLNLGATPKKRGYQDKRHPLLGWYRGDDQNVLDWQCYWLRESGVSSVVAQSRGTNFILDTTDWANLSNINNWIYKLCNTVPNADGLGIIPWIAHGDFSNNFGNATELAAIESAWDNNILAIHDSKREHVVSHHGKKYITLYCFEGESLRGDFDNYIGSSVLQVMLASRATYAQSLGYDGVAVMARNPTSNALMNRGSLLENGVLYFGANYTTTLTSGTNSAVYATYQDAVDAWTHDKVALVSVPGVHLEAQSSNHPTDWDQGVSNAKQFKDMLGKAVEYAKITENALDMVTVYNISEWAEGGVSLQPTVGNDWDFLDAIRDVTASLGKEVHVDNYIKNYKPTSTINNTSVLLGLGSDFNQTFSMTPLIEAGSYEGQIVTIVNYEPVGGTTVTLADDSVTAGTTLFFKGGSSLILLPWESVDMRWFSDKGWLEI